MKICQVSNFLLYTGKILRSSFFLFNKALNFVYSDFENLVWFRISSESCLDKKSLEGLGGNFFWKVSIAEWTRLGDFDSRTSKISRFFRNWPVLADDWKHLGFGPGLLMHNCFGFTGKNDFLSQYEFFLQLINPSYFPW